VGCSASPSLLCLAETIGPLSRLASSWITPRMKTPWSMRATRGLQRRRLQHAGDVSLSVNFFKPEFATNYEIGTKLAFFDQRLRLDLTASTSTTPTCSKSVFIHNETTGVNYPDHKCNERRLEGYRIGIPGHSLCGAAGARSGHAPSRKIRRFQGSRTCSRRLGLLAAHLSSGPPTQGNYCPWLRIGRST